MKIDEPTAKQILAGFDHLFQQPDAEELRDDFWRIGSGIVWKYFPINSGTGTLVEAFQLAESWSYLKSTYVNHAHNRWLEIALTGGLSALLILGVALLFFVKTQLASLASDRSGPPSCEDCSAVLSAHCNNRVGQYCLLSIAAPYNDVDLRHILPVAHIPGTCELRQSRARKNMSLEMAKRENKNDILAAIKQIGPVRIVIVTCIAIIGGGGAIMLAISGIARTSNPNVALAALPSKSVALAARADLILLAEPLAIDGGHSL